MNKFTGAATQYNRNLQDGQALNAARARLATPRGTVEPGVAIFHDRRPLFIIPTADALRLAHEIADALTTHNRTENP